MAHHRFAVPQSAASAVLETAHCLTSGNWTPGIDVLPTPEPTEIERVLLDTAAGVLMQLRILHSLAASAAQSRTLTVSIHLAAEEHGIASGAAIGVTGELADLLAGSYVPEIARILQGARSVFGDEELLNGAAAMLATTSALVAARLDVDPADVVDQVASVMAPARCHRPVDRRRCRRRLLEF